MRGNIMRYEQGWLLLAYSVNAGYGATPWFSTVAINGCSVRLFFDTGSEFSWVTSTLCDTAECDAHKKVSPNPDTLQPTRKIDFDPWGELYVRLGTDNLLVLPTGASYQHFATNFSQRYTGQKFGTLAQDGASAIVRFPKDKSQDFLSFVESDAMTFMFGEGKMLWVSPAVALTYTPCIRPGDPNFADYDSAYTLWTTRLWGLSVEGTEIQTAAYAYLFADTGSSSAVKCCPELMDDILKAVFGTCTVSDKIGTAAALDAAYPSLRVSLQDAAGLPFLLEVKPSAFFRVENLGTDEYKAGKGIYSLDVQTFDALPSPTVPRGGIIIGTDYMQSLRAVQFDRSTDSIGWAT